MFPKMNPVIGGREGDKSRKNRPLGDSLTAHLSRLNWPTL
jgi:hypothetical protein